MAETKPTATVKTTTSVQPRKSSNVISWIAPLACLILGYVIWRFVLGNPANFTVPIQIKAIGFGLHTRALKELSIKCMKVV